MNQEQVIALAREAGFYIEKWSYGESVSVYESGKTIDITNELKEFAVLVAAKLFTYDQVKAHIQAAVLSERQRTVDILMQLHRNAKGEHNYYHFAANEIRGFSV